MTSPSTITQDELRTLLVDRFGPDPYRWAFQCPACGDVATGADFRDALTEHPRTHRDGTPVAASDLLGGSCIGRVLGALSVPTGQEWTGRGCDWTAHGLFRGPVTVALPDGKTTHAFHVAPAPERPGS